MAKRTDVSQLKIGDKFYRVVHYEVTGIEGNNVHTKSDTAGRSTISKGLVENSGYTTNQYVEKKKVTRTQLAQKIETLGHAAFKVIFKKQVAVNDIADGLSGADVTTQAKRRKVVKNLWKARNASYTPDFTALKNLTRQWNLDATGLSI